MHAESAVVDGELVAVDANGRPSFQALQHRAAHPRHVVVFYAFDLLHRILDMRLRRGRLTVVDATNVEDWARAELLAVARRHRRPAMALILDVPLEVALERNARRPSPRPPPTAVRRQYRWLHDLVHAIGDEGFSAVHHLRSVDAIEAVAFDR